MGGTLVTQIRKDAKYGKFVFSLSKIGFFALFIACFYAFFRLYFRSPAEHYDLFVTSGRLLLEKHSPYGTDFNPIGRWFYSPSCGLLLFAPLSFLPKMVGMSLYVFGGLALLITGIFQWCKILKVKNIGVVFGLLAPQFMSAIWATKIELISTGVLLLLVGCLFKLTDFGSDHSNEFSRIKHGSKYKINFKLHLVLMGLAMIGDWKLQTVPATGLVLLGLAIMKGNWKNLVYFGMYLVGFKFLPLLWFDWEKLMRMYTIQKDDLSAFMRAAIFSFDNIFNFAHSSLGVTVRYQFTFWISVGVALSMTLYTCWLGMKYRKNAKALPWLMITALALGSAFSILFNPISQNNAYIQITPLMVALVVTFERLHLQSRFALWFSATVGWLILAFAYSDLFTEVLRPLTLKPFGAAVLLVAVSEAMARLLKTESKFTPESV